MTLPSRAAVEAGLQAHNAAFFAGKRHDDLTIAAIEAAYAVDFPGGAPQAGASDRESKAVAQSGEGGQDAVGSSASPAPASSVRGEISEEERLLDEALARPNDWPLDDDNVGFWIPRSALLKLRAILRESRKETR